MDAVAHRTADAARRRELADFLRRRRERITPAEAGLPVVGTRRTPGLRREEVAQLAGVGITWYTWLEQGRDIRPSVQVLDALATALQLGRHEREHLHLLAHGPGPDQDVQDAGSLAAVRPVLAKLDPHPAVVHNARTDVLAYNRGYAWLTGIDDVAPAERNALLLYATHPLWRSRVRDWPDRLPGAVAEFRTQMSRHLDDPRWPALVERLCRASPAFADAWRRHDVSPMRGHRKRFRHPEAGELAYDFAHFWFGARSELRVTVYTPADRRTRDAGHRVAGDTRS